MSSASPTSITCTLWQLAPRAAVNLLIVWACYALALLGRGLTVTLEYRPGLAFAILASAIVVVCDEALRIIWRRRFATTGSLARLAVAVGAALVVVTGLDLVWPGNSRPLPLSVVLVGALLAFAALAVERRRLTTVAVPITATIILGAILTLGLAARLLIALTLPPWQTPDEPKHFEYIRLLVDLRSTLWAERRLLTFDDADPVLQREIIASLARNNYWEGIRQVRPNPLPSRFSEVWPGGTDTQLHRPSLYYLLAAPLLLPFVDAPLDVQLVVVRLFSVLLSSLTIWVTYLAARIVAPDDLFVPLTGAAFVAALPMHVYIGASVNNDNLAVLLGSVVCLGLIWGLGRGFSSRIWLLVASAFVLGLTTKRGIVGLAPIIGLAWLFWLPSLRGWRLGLGLGVLGLTGLVGLALLDALGPGIGLAGLLPDRLREKINAYALNEPDQLQRLLSISLDSPDVYQIILVHLELLFRGFWGVFGWFALHLAPELYHWLVLVTALGAVGFALHLAQQALRWWTLKGAEPCTVASQAGRRVLIGLLCLAAIVTMVALTEGERLAYFAAGRIPQGRYLFVVIVPIALALALGARTLLPARLLGTWLPLLVIFLALLALDVDVFVNYLWPFFRSGLPV